MQFITVLTFAAAASAAALQGSRKTARLEARSLLCPPLDSPQCCQIDVDGVVDLSCEAPTGSPSTTSAFEKSCSKSGRSAMCCTVVIGTDSLLCQDA